MKVTIARKLFIGFAILLTLMIVLNVVSHRSLNKVRKSGDLILQHSQELNAVDRLRFILLEALTINDYFITGDMQKKEHFSELSRAVEKEIRDSEQLFYIKEEKEFIMRIKEQFGVINEKADEIMEFADFSKKEFVGERVNNIVAETDIAASIVVENVEDLYDFVKEELAQITKVAKRTELRATQLIIVTSIVAVIFGMIAMLILIHDIAKPIQRLTAATQDIAQGQFNQKINIKTNDEIEDLANSFNEMAQALSDAENEVMANNRQLKTINQALTASEQRTRTIINVALDAVIIMNHEGNILDWNPHAEKIFGWSRDEMIGQRLSEFIIPVRYRKMHQNGLKRFLETGEGAVFDKRIEIEALNREGKEFPVELAIAAIPTGAGHIFSAFINDITERKTFQENLKNEKELAFKLRKDAEKATRAKSEFLANMSHEIRTPMNSVVGFSELLQKTPLDEKQSGYLGAITSSGQLLVGIINDILDYSKIESGKITLESIDFNLKYLIKDVFNMIITRMKDHPFDTYIDIEKDVPIYLTGDPTRLRQIFLNLLGNAMKFTSEGSIGVLVQKEEGSTDQSPMLRFSVKDTGIGIPEDKVEDIFNSFTQADTSTTRKFGGTGLGLSISKSIIEIMGGEIWAESEEGEGTEFIFRIKFEKAKEITGKEIYPLKKYELTGRKILIVDDNEIARKIHATCCESMGIKIVSLEDSAQSALDRLNKLVEEDNLPELILCDLIMTDMDGYELAAKIRADERLKGIKMIAVTTDPKIGEANMAEEKGFDGYLPKPVILEDLAQVIQTVLGDKREEKTIVTRHMAEELSCKGIKVLVVENSPPNQMLMQAYFEELGCEGVYANNGQEAVDKLKAGEEYDLILMDMQMPVMGGIEATEIIRRDMTKDIPIIALTADIIGETRQKADMAGMNDFIAKPIDLEKLKEKIIQYGRS